jgi:hypothetical protein
MGWELGSVPIDPTVISERLVSGYLQVAGPNNPNRQSRADF